MPSSRYLVVLVSSLSVVVGFWGCSNDEPDGGAPPAGGRDAAAAGHQDGSAADAADDGRATDASPDAEPPPSAPENFASGTRLKIIAHVGGGLAVYSGFYDSLLQQACTPYPSASGALRCMFGSYVDRPLYLNADCTDPVVVRTSCSPPAYAFAAVTGGYETRHLGEALATPAALYERAAGGCTPSAATVGEGQQLRRLGASVADDELASLEVTKFGQGRLQATGFRGADGAYYYERNTSLLFDSAEQQSCTRLLDPSGQSRCFVGSSAVPVFLDDECVTPGAGTHTNDPRYLLLSEALDPANQCSAMATRAYVPGAREGQAHELMGESCRASFASQFSARLGEERPSESFVALSERWQGGGRLQVSVLDTGADLFRGTLRDEQLGAACLPRLTTAGSLACVPAESIAELSYLDAECTLPAAQLAACATPPGALSQLVGAADACGEVRWRAFRAGAPQSGPRYQRRPDQCVRVEENAARLVPLVEIAPEALPAMERQVLD